MQLVDETVKACIANPLWFPIFESRVEDEYMLMSRDGTVIVSAYSFRFKAHYDDWDTAEVVEILSYTNKKWTPLKTFKKVIAEFDGSISDPQDIASKFRVAYKLGPSIALKL